VDVTHKPLIALVWGGFYVMMAGGLLAFVKRSKEARKAVLEASTQPARAEAPVAPTGPALPAHTRSPLG
jgi:LPXTG-motif cell wall-anchored protein